MSEAAVWDSCRCGRIKAQSSGTITSLVCDQCPPPPHEGGLLAAVDEWCHRHGRYAGWHWRHPLGSLFWFAYRPLCNLRERRLYPLDFDGAKG